MLALIERGAIQFSRISLLRCLNVNTISKQIFIYLFAITLSACVSVMSTQELKPGERNRTSFAYMLPKAVVPIQLFENEGEFIINALEPKYLGDPKHFYYGTYSASPFSSDTVNVTVEPNGLLKTVNVVAEDKTGEFLINLAKSLAAIQTGFATEKEADLSVSATKISEIHIDPDDPESMVAGVDAMNSAARITIRDGISKNCSASDEKKKELCGVYRRLRNSKFRIDLSVYAPEITRQIEMPDCSIGVCFRLPIPYRITAGFRTGRDATLSSVMVPLPNGGPIIATNFDRTLFVKKVINAGFTNGVLTTLTVEKPSEAAAVALLPATIISAFFETITSTFGSKKAAITAEIQYLEEFDKLNKQRNSNREKEAALSLGQKPTLLRIGIGSHEKGKPIDNQSSPNTNGQSDTTATDVGNGNSSQESPQESPFEESSPPCETPPCPS